MKRQLMETDLIESFDQPLREATIEERDDRSIIRNVVALGERSVNGRTYPPETQVAAYKLFEGAKAFLNHGNKNSGGTRLIEDLIGRHKNVRQKGSKIYSDLNLINNKLVRETILPAIRYDPSIAGCSINARGKLNATTGIVGSITAVRSIDLVCEPATTSGLLESVNRRLPSDNEAVLRLIEASKVIPAEYKLNCFKRCKSMPMEDAQMFIETLEQSIRIMQRQRSTSFVEQHQHNGGGHNRLLSDYDVANMYNRLGRR